MTKEEFLLQLTNRLSPLPWEEIKDRWKFYSEMIDDRIEDGLSEEEAVAELGAVNDVATQILADVPLATLVKEKIKPKKRMRSWNIVLLILGFPLWFPLLLTALVVMLALYLVLWVPVICCWAIFASLAAGAFGGIAAGVLFIANGNTAPGIAVLACGLIVAGLAIFAFIGSKAATAGIAVLTEKIVLGIKRRLVRKEAVA